MLIGVYDTLTVTINTALLCERMHYNYVVPDMIEQEDMQCHFVLCIYYANTRVNGSYRIYQGVLRLRVQVLMMLLLLAPASALRELSPPTEPLPLTAFWKLHAKHSDACYSLSLYSRFPRSVPSSRLESSSKTKSQKKFHEPQEKSVFTNPVNAPPYSWCR